VDPLVAGAVTVAEHHRSEVAVILVVGATGQLGSTVVRELAGQGRPVRAMVRPPDPAHDLVEAGAEVVAADLLRPETLDDAVRAVVATANVVAPSHRGESHDALADGYAELITRARAAGVERFVHASVPETPLDDAVPMIRAKRKIEQLLAVSGLSHVAPRMPPFSEVWPALVGSSIPVRGVGVRAVGGQGGLTQSRAVRMRGPSAVTATVCSTCAARLPSPLRNVQPSASTR
jgi:uncharacterized protein YbjT (DUF2867 family)